MAKNKTNSTMDCSNQTESNKKNSTKDSNNTNNSSNGKSGASNCKQSIPLKNTGQALGSVLFILIECQDGPY